MQATEKSQEELTVVLQHGAHGDIAPHPTTDRPAKAQQYSKHPSLAVVLEDKHPISIWR